MTNAEILIAAIDVAIVNGWDGRYKASVLYEDTELYLDANIHNREDWIFSHPFAKAFWGEDSIKIEDNPMAVYQGCAGGMIVKKRLGWQYHLQLMVLEEDPIKYLEQFLDKEEEFLDKEEENV